MTKATLRTFLALCLFFTATLSAAPTAGYLWGAPNGITNSLQTFDPTTGTVLGGTTISTQGSLIYVAKNGVSLLIPNNTSLIVLSGATGIVTNTVTLPDYASAVVLSPDGTKAYIAGSHSIMVLTLASLKVTQQYNLPGAVLAMAVSPDGTKIYASVKSSTPTETGLCTSKGKYFTGLCEFSTSNFKLLAQAPLLDGQVMVSQDGKTVYSIPAASGKLLALDSSTLKKTATLITGTGNEVALGMNMSPTGNSAAVFVEEIQLSDQVVEAMLLNTQTNQLTPIYFFGFMYPTLYIGPDPYVSSSAAFSRDGSSLWMLSQPAYSAAPTLVGIQIPSGTLISNTTLPLAASEVTF